MRKYFLKLIILLPILIIITSCSENVVIDKNQNSVEISELTLGGLVSEEIVTERNYTDIIKDQTDSIIYTRADGMFDLYRFSSPVLGFDDYGNWLFSTGEFNEINSNSVSRNEQYIWNNEVVFSKIFWPEKIDNINKIYISPLRSNGYAYIYLGSVADSVEKLRKNNIFNDLKNMLCYTSEKFDSKYYFYPSNSGFVCEIECDISDLSNASSFIVELNGIESFMSHKLYTIFNMNGYENIPIAIQSMGAKFCGEFIDTEISTEDIGDNIYKLNLSVSSDKVKNSGRITAILSFEICSESLIWDSQACEGQPNINSYVKSYFTLGDNSSYWGDQRSYLKFTDTSLRNIDIENVRSVSLMLRNMGSDDGAVIKVSETAEDWCSKTLCWNDMPDTGKEIGEFHSSSDGYFYIDFTDYFKTYYLENKETLTEIGICIESSLKSQSNVILPTADNAIYPYGLIITYIENN